MARITRGSKIKTQETTVRSINKSRKRALVADNTTETSSSNEKISLGKLDSVETLATATPSKKSRLSPHYSILNHSQSPEQSAIKTQPLPPGTRIIPGSYAGGSSSLPSISERVPSSSSTIFGGQGKLILLTASSVPGIKKIIQAPRFFHMRSAAHSIVPPLDGQRRIFVASTSASTVVESSPPVRRMNIKQLVPLTAEQIGREIVLKTANLLKAESSSFLLGGFH